MKEPVAVVVIAYKTTLNDYERISLARLREVLGRYPVYYCMPDHISPDYLAHGEVSTVRFDRQRFADVNEYSRLLRSPEFYAAFSRYRYILVAQLDTFIFKDDLEKWCGRDFDYIGAPWVFEVVDFSPYLRTYLPLLHKYKALSRLRPYFHSEYLVGNGGLSLRKVDTFLQVLARHGKKVRKYDDWCQRLCERGINTAHNEDNFWALYVPRIHRSFKIPPFSEAVDFAIETAPEYCYAVNNRKLPFGCHAWDKHGTDFWRPFFHQCGYDI